MALLTAIGSTTLSGALTSSTTLISLASGTGVLTPSLSGANVGSILVVDQEVMQVTSAGSLTTLFNVKRGVLGTAAVPHATSAKVWVTDANIQTGDPSRPITSDMFFGGRAAYESVPTGFTPPLNGVATASVADIAGQIWYTALNSGKNAIVTGIAILNGSTVTTDKWIVAIWNTAGVLIATSALAGVTTAGVSIYQSIPFINPVALPTGLYLAGLQGNGTTDHFQAYATGGLPSTWPTGIQAGTFGTVPNITTPATTFTAAVGPVMALY